MKEAWCKSPSDAKRGRQGKTPEKQRGKRRRTREAPETTRGRGEAKGAPEGRKEREAHLEEHLQDKEAETIEVGEASGKLRGTAERLVKNCKHYRSEDRSWVGASETKSGYKTGRKR